MVLLLSITKEPVTRATYGVCHGDRGVNNATAVMGQYQEHVKHLETDGGHSEEVDGDQLLGVILQECTPGLRRRLAAVHHVFAYAALTDVDAEFEQFAVDARCTPIGIFSAHLADQTSDLP